MRVPQYFSLYSWLFWTTVPGKRVPREEIVPDAKRNRCATTKTVRQSREIRMHCDASSKGVDFGSEQP